MNKILILAILIGTSIESSFGQITTTKVAPVAPKTVGAYDSTKNFLGNLVVQYSGQEFYVLPKYEGLRKYGHDGFILDRTKSSTDKSNIYKYNPDCYSSDYNQISEKYFQVLGVYPESERDHDPKISYIKLKEKISGDTLYFKYKSDSPWDFPFLVTGYFEKQKQLIGKEFMLRGENSWNEGKPTYDFKTGQLVDITTGVLWKAKEVTIEGTYFEPALVLENDKGESILFHLDDIDDEGFILTKTKSESYKKKFGIEKFNKIMKGKASIGMTKEMCKLAWGEPEKINETITAGKKSEQWVYSDNYLYFSNGILTAIQ